MEENELHIYFGGDLTNLYDIGWLASDLSQLIDFSTLIQTNDQQRIEKFFGENARPFNRYTKLVDKPLKRPEIVDVKHGSVALTIAGCSVAAAVILPLVQIAVQRYFSKKDEEISFEIYAKDDKLRRILNAYAAGDFGTGTDALNTLFSILAKQNYNVTALADNIYQIEHVVDKYAQRMIKTIKKNRLNNTN